MVVGTLMSDQQICSKHQKQAVITTGLAQWRLSKSQSIPLLQVFNCLIEWNERNKSQLSGSATRKQSCCLNLINKQRRDAFYRCDMFFCVFSRLFQRRDVDLYPVSSMMQPSQASGHLQSPVKKSRRKKSVDEGGKDDLNKSWERNNVVIGIYDPSCDKKIYDPQTRKGFP